MSENHDVDQNETVTITLRAAASRARSRAHEMAPPEGEGHRPVWGEDELRANALRSFASELDEWADQVRNQRGGEQMAGETDDY